MEQQFEACSPVDQFERDFVRPKPGYTLIVGSRVYDGSEPRQKRYPDAIGVDMLPGPGVDSVRNLEEPLAKWMTVSGGPFDHIECLSVLEHSRRPWLLAANIERLLVPGGTLHVQVPFVWRVHAYPGDFWRFTIDGVRELFPRIRWHSLQYAHAYLTPKNKIPAMEAYGGRPYFCRTEVCGFGELVE